MKSYTKLNKYKKLTLGAYIAISMSAIIVLFASLFTLYNLFNLKNIASVYESDNYKLRYSISTLLIKTLMIDIEKGDYSSTKGMIEVLKRDNLLAYSYVKDNKTQRIILGKDVDQEIEQYQNGYSKSNIQQLSKDIGNYTVYFGIQADSKINYKSFLTAMLNILFMSIACGVVLSIIVADFLSKPLNELSKATKRMADGNFNVKLKESLFAEVNDLIFSYNQLGFQLSELYSSLELKVQERTIALETTNYKLQETQAMMVHSEKMRSLGELVAGIAHEINNPVNFIHGNIMILQNYVDDLMKLIDMYEENNVTLPENIKTKIEDLKNDIDLDFLKTDVKDLIRSCIEGTERTKNIILDLKNFSRMEEMVLTQFDIPKEIDTTLNILNNKYKNRITVVKNYSSDTPKIEAYGGQLNQVFMNILDNAQDAMGASGTLTINVYRKGENVIIEFIDTGKGIAKENLSKVFDPFFTTKPVGKGTGLGMSISYRVINDHNGKIEIESEVNVGTKFTVTLPICHEQKSDESSDDMIVDDVNN